MLLFVAVLPMLVLLMSYVWQSQRRATEDVRNQAAHLVEQLAAAQGEWLEQNRRLLQRISQSSAVERTDDPDCSRFLQQIATLSDDYLNLSVARPDGELTCSASALSGRVNVADRGFFQQALSTRRFAIGTSQVDRVSKMAGLALAYPIFDQERGRMTGVLIAMLSLKGWSQRLGDLLLPYDAVAVLTDANHRIIARYPYNERALGLYADSYGFELKQAAAHPESIYLSRVDLSGQQRMTAVTGISLESDKPALFAGISLPVAMAVAASRTALWQGLALGGGALLFLFAALLWTLSRHVSQPLNRLLEYARSLEHGPIVAKPESTAPMEIRALQSQLTGMIEARLDTETHLQDNESRLRQIAETIREVVWVVTPDWKQVLYVNPAYERVWQRPVNSLYRAPASWLNSVVQEDRQPLLDFVAGLGEQNQTDIRFPLYRIERRDGTLRWISAKGFPAYDADGKLSSIVGIAEDVTERKQYEAELSEREAKYRLLVENAEDLVVKVDTQGRFLFISPSYCRTFGKSEHQLLGKTFLPLVHEDDQTATTETMKGLYYPPFSVYLEQRAMTVQGWRWFGWSNTSVLDEHQRVVEIIGVGRDITAQKQVELALRESETRYRELVDNMSDGVAVYQRIGDSENFLITQFNHAAERMAGYTREQVIGQQVDVLFPGVSEMGLLETIRRVAREGMPKRMPVSTYRDNRLRLWLEYYVFRLPSSEVVAVFRDVTAEQRALESLMRSEERFRGFFEETSVGLLIADRAGRAQEANNAFTRLFGLERSELVARPLTKILLPGNSPEIAESLNDLLAGRIDHSRFQAEYELADERRLIVNVSIGALQDERQQRAWLYVMAEDVTDLVTARNERDKLQRALMHDCRLEALGRLAGGIAEDFNTILGNISGFVELAETRLGRVDSRQILDYLEKSRESMVRARQLVKQLLIFSCDSTQQSLRPHDLRQLVADSMEAIRSALPEQVGVDLQPGQQPLPVLCEPVQIEQILLNLCLHAGEAMGGEGQIQVRLERFLAQGEPCAICSQPVAGEWFSLQVQDSGGGLSEAEMERLFEPGFTARDVDQRGGLGLAVLAAIVACLEGHLLIENKPNEGSGFRILFPLHRAQQDEQHRSAAASIPEDPMRENV